MTKLLLRYENNRCTDDLEFVLERPDGELSAVSFVATVPHHCESSKVFGDLFDCHLNDIETETLPVIRGSNRELAIIRRLKDYADATMSADEQYSLLHARFTQMSQSMCDHRTLLWFIGVLEERRQRDDTKLEPGS